MGLSALDQENGTVQTCVRSGQIGRGRLPVPRQRQCHQNTGSAVHRTGLRCGWHCPRSLVAAACRGLLCWGAPHHNRRGRQGARTYAPVISTGALTIGVMLRDPCHAALPDQPVLAQIGSGLSTGGARRHPCPLRSVGSGSSVDTAGAVACCVGAPLSYRQKAVQTRLSLRGVE